jgi:SNF2 family DNA or RNA helicase
MTIRALKEPNLAAKLSGFLYQAQALEATRDLPFAAIFHEQGLGKTKIGLDIALYWLAQKSVDSVLIVTKRGLIQNWRDEMAAHTHVQPRVLSQDRKANFLAFNSPARIYLTHYETLKSEKKRMDLFLKTRRVGIILDESHKIKNPESALTRVMFELAPGFVRRVIMTGTPVANRPYDLWAQIYFLDQGASLGTDFSTFRKDLDLSNELAFDSTRAAHFSDSLARVFNKISDFSVRETKARANIKLPRKEFLNIPVLLESRQSEIYDNFRREFAAIVIKDGKPQLDDAEGILKRLMRLVQVASNPRLVDQGYHQIPGKLPILSDLIDEIHDRGEKAIVWTAFTDNVDWLTREFRNRHAVKVHGKLSYEERNRSLTRFKSEPECMLLIATPASAKEGLTLTVANNVIFFDRSFSLDDYLQAQDRIHRISQEKPCTVINLVATDTVDEWVDVLLSAKQLAAQLGQGDISKEEYDANANYAFGEMVRDVLGRTGATNGH